jgi:hypothetical protein
MSNSDAAPLSPETASHLNLLAIFHYVVAGISALFALFPIFHLAMGIWIIFSPATFAARDEHVPVFVGWFFVLFAAIWIFFGLAFAVALAFAGFNLQRRKYYVFCLVMAAVACFFMPFGTILGVLTIILLTKPEVKQTFT